MTQHFAASWLQSLEKKLEALTEWSWDADQRGECTTHRNLFREFFNPKFQKTLALVDDQKRLAFFSHIERNLHKFEGRTQQFPLGCLCALLQHGKASPKTKEKVTAWIDFLLSKLRQGHGKEVVTELVEECLSPAFQKFVPVMEEGLMDRLIDGLGEHLISCDDDVQKKVLEDFSAVPQRIERIMRTCTEVLNGWLDSAPRFPSTPLLLTDTLTKMNNPLVRFFNRIKDANVKESFLVSVALCLQCLRNRFRWMCAVEPGLESLGADLQAKLFTVEGQGTAISVMERWLQSRLNKYNMQVGTKASQLLVSDPSKLHQLKLRLTSLFPERSAADPNSGWVALDGPSKVADGLLSFLVENDSGFFCPQHTLARETLMGVLQRFGPIFETDAQRTRVRLVQSQPPPPAMPTPQFPPIPPGQAVSLVAAPGQGPNVVPPPPGLPPASVLQSAAQGAPQVPIITLPGESAPATADSADADNLVDLLLSEELEPLPSHIRAKICKMAHGVYRFGEKEVTLHTQSGRLFVYRVGMMVRNCPLKMLLQEEGLVPAPDPPPSATPALSSSASAVDTSSVAKIASMSAKISAGVTMTTTVTQQKTENPFTQNSDPSRLMSKRVEAATRAMDVSKQIVRRSINFDNEKFLRKILAKGLKHDKTFSVAYSEFCNSRGISEQDHRKQSRETVATFIERNLAACINEEWVKKVISANDEEKKEKKDKKKKDKKEKKDKKRKASESGSSSPERQQAFATEPAAVSAIPTMQPPPSQPPVMHPPPMPPPPSMDMPMGMPMFPPGMPLGMMAQMGMGGMVPPFGPGMMADGIASMGLDMMGMDMMEDPRARKKSKADKAEKKSKNKR